MQLRQLLTLSAALALSFGLGFLSVPAIVLNLYGIGADSGTQLMGQYFGVELLAVGLVAWFSREVADPKARRALVRAFLIANAVGLVVSVLATVAGLMNSLGWSVVLIYLVLTLGFAYFYVARPELAAPVAKA